MRKLSGWLLKPLYNWRLREKLFVMFLLGGILPLLFFVLYSYMTIRSELSEQMVANTASTVAQINTNLENKLDTYTKLSATVYLDSTLRAYLTNDYSKDPSLFVDAYKYINNSFVNMLTTNPDIDSMTVYISNETLPADDLFIKRMDERFRESLAYKSLSGSFGNVRFVTSPSEPDAPPIFTLSRMLNINSMNNAYGVLTINILESDIFRLMEKESSDKTVLIINEQGIVMSAKDKSLLNQPIGLPDVFPADSEGRFDSMYNGEKMLVVYNTTKYGWKSVSLVPYSSFLSKANLATKRIFIYAMGSLAVMALLIYVTARLFTKRVETLVGMMRRIEKEEFELADVRPLGRDEIGQIGNALRKMGQRLSSLISDVYKKEIDKREAELNVLQAQINPHFLYNSLASISSLAIRNADPRMNKMVTDLAKFYRISLNKGKNTLSIHEELQLTRYYVSIQQVRFGNLLRVQFDIDDAVLPCPIIKLTLQPFVENCINHAIWDHELGVNIVIRACRDGSDIVLKVIDDGMGMRLRGDSELPQSGDKLSGYGIRNVDNRIKLLYGDTYGVSIFSRLGIGTTVSIRIPGR
ncbi:sensor histidine kinase [Paenibacillus prosopidis]|uniref:Two-component system sensor histidine kinase YesM n=1 Tax=Paenibacillus prosopidis TaxID=630520 RepID=A0A368W7X9_9BACL|nr:sensor histidine kinase [Paenibacillus prosopidis]RCW51755.1 two-component system sensor histidine kinase YesM [Paenibacillus prosopidis]